MYQRRFTALLSSISKFQYQNTYAVCIFQNVLKATICDTFIHIPYQNIQNQSRCYCQDKQDKPSSSLSGSSGSGSDDGEDKDKRPKENETYDPKKDPFFTQDVAYGRKENKGGGDPERPYFDPSDTQTIATSHVVEAFADAEDDDEVLEPPTTCCRSGCPNCVWIDYVEKLSKRYSSPELSREKILKDLESMDDESIKAFIKLELKGKGLL